MHRSAAWVWGVVAMVVTLSGGEWLWAEETKFDESNERTRLYEEPDPDSPGGLQGRVVAPAKPIQQVLAIPPDAPEEVYQGEISGEKRDSFRFTGLPMRKYDLMIIFEGQFYEGLQLHRGDSTLTGEDEAKVKAIIDKSEPFFTKKVIHRLEGETGRGNLSRCVVTFVREKPSLTYMDAKNADKSSSGYFRRTFKLVILKDVGPGWQVVRARDLYPKWADPKSKLPRHFFHPDLSRIRVADSVKDVGELDLSDAAASTEAGGGEASGEESAEEKSAAPTEQPLSVGPATRKQRKHHG